MANGGIIGTVNNPTSSTATGVWQQEEQYEAVRDGTWPKRAVFTTKSARFNSGSSDYLTFTPSADTNRKCKNMDIFCVGKNGKRKSRLFFSCWFWYTIKIYFWCLWWWRYRHTYL